MFEAVLTAADAARATSALQRLSGRGLRFVLTGGLALEARLRQAGGAWARRDLNDLDLVVEGAQGLPEGLAEGLLVNHAHPLALEGKLVLQLVDPQARLRVDLFRAYGATLSRAARLGGDTGDLAVVALEDLRARLTANVFASMRRAQPIDVKYVAAFRRLLGHGDPAVLGQAWEDHREGLETGFAEAAQEAERRLAERPDLVIVETYAQRREACAKCGAFASFRLSPPDEVLGVLGYV